MTTAVSIGPLSNRDSRYFSQFYNDEKLSDEESARNVAARSEPTLAVGSTELYDEYGQIRLIPVKDPQPFQAERIEAN